MHKVATMSEVKPPQGICIIVEDEAPPDAESAAETANVALEQATSVTQPIFARLLSGSSATPMICKIRVCNSR